LECTIDQALQMANGKITFTFTISNKDSFNYLILSPEKMGFALFNYFTNGLLIRVPGETLKSHKDRVIKPDPWNGWDQRWFDLLFTGTNRSYTLTYENFDPIPVGKYDISFEFPGLSYQVSRDELIQESGRIWLGDIRATGTIVIK
jgi:hypothetical protein